MATINMTTTERSAAIRAALKQRGISSRDVSIRSDYYAGGSSIRIKVKNPNVSTKLVEEIANAHESIRRCEMTGEILSGGNRFVFVEYAHETYIIFESRYLAAVQVAADVLNGESDSTLIPVEGTPYLIGKWNGGYSIWDQTSRCGDGYDVKAVAQSIGAKMARG